MKVAFLKTYDHCSLWFPSDLETSLKSSRGTSMATSVCAIDTMNSLTTPCAFASKFFHVRAPKVIAL